MSQNISMELGAIQESEDSMLNDVVEQQQGEQEQQQPISTIEPELISSPLHLGFEPPQVVEAVVKKEEDTKKKKKFRYYENYITKVLKKISEKSEITLNARQQLNNFIINLSKKISSTAIDLTEISKKKTISGKEVRNAVRIIMPNDLSNECLSFADESITHFENETKSEPSGAVERLASRPEGAVENAGLDSKSSSRQSKAGIIFPPSISEKFLRRWGNSNIMVTSQAPIYLASVIEYIVTEILEDSNLTTVSENRVRITVRDMDLAVKRHSTLRELFVKNNFEFLGGGVVPFIHPNIKYDKNGERTNISHTISSYQNTGDCLMFAKHPFEQVIRGVVNSIKSDAKISSDVLTLIQYYIEQWLVDVLRNANYIALYSNRLKVVPTDIEMVLALMEKRVPPFFQRKN
jgi:histone H2A